MFTYRQRIQAPPPPIHQPSTVHIPPSFIPNRQYLQHLNRTTQTLRPKFNNYFTPPSKQFIETNYFGLPAVYSLPGELDFEYTKFVGKHPYQYAPSENGPLQRTWRDLNIRPDNDVSTEFFQNQTKPDPDGFDPRYSLPTDETFVSPHEPESDYESESSSSGNNTERERSSNWDRRNNTQYDSDATSPDEFSDDDSSDYYDSDSEDEWSFPRQYENNSVPTGLTLKEAVLSYEKRWNAMLTQRLSGNQLIFETVPWPQYPPPKSPAEFNHRSIREFLRAAGGPSSFMLKAIFRQTMLRFHPDKSAVLLAHVDERQRRLVFEGCTAVARCLNDIKDLF